MLDEKLGISLYNKEKMINDIYEYIIKNLDKIGYNIQYDKDKFLDISQFIDFADNIKVFIKFSNNDRYETKGNGGISILTHRDSKLVYIINDKIIIPSIYIDIHICNNNISKRGIYHTLYHELNHLYQAYLSRKTNWYHFSSMNGRIISSLNNKKYELLNKNLITMIYRLLSETEYSSMLSGSWSDMLYYKGCIINTYGYLFYECYSNLLKESIKSIDKSNFELYKELLREYNLQKYLKQDINNFKSNLKKCLTKKFNKLWKDLSRLDRLYKIRETNESFRLKSFDEFILD